MPARLTLENFIERASAVHNGKYDYSKVVYKNGTTKVCITCPVDGHGDFMQRPYMHLQGQGCPECAKLERKATCQSRYGNPVPMVSEENREKAKRTNLERYGSENVMGCPEVVARISETTMKNWGVKNAMQSLEIKEKAAQTNLRKYGHRSSFQSEAVRAKHKVNMLRKHGVENSFQIPEVQAKRLATWRANYGVDNPRQAPEIDKKIRATCLERYGTEYAIAADEVKEKIVATNMARFGVPNALMSPEVRAKLKATNLELYGSENCLGSPMIIAKARATCRLLYGVDYAMQNPDIAAKSFATKLERGTTNTSGPEDLLYDMLCCVFDADDIVREQPRPDYPFHCDFYIKSRNMYIELNAFWTHGGHWFDSKSSTDLGRLCELHRRAQTSDFYKAGIETWTDSDVAKRECAWRNNLNYIVFWRSDLLDAEAWFAAGCPDGTDWDDSGSWLEKV